MEIEVSRRFRKLMPEIDNFSAQLGERVGKLSLVHIARTLQGNGRLYHDDGVYDFANLIPTGNGDCLAQILHPNGKTEEVKFSYDESGILVPDDTINRKILHLGSLRKPHPQKLSRYIDIKGILERRVGESALINDNRPPGNSIYSMRILGDVNGVGYNASFMADDGSCKVDKYGYDSLATVLVTDEKFCGELSARSYE